MTRLEQAELVASALDQMATQLLRVGVPADIIAPATLGWAVGKATQVAEPTMLADTLRDAANRIDGFALPVAGSA